MKNTSKWTINNYNLKIRSQVILLQSIFYIGLLSFLKLDVT